MDDYISRQAVLNKCGDWYVEEGPEYGFIGSVNQMLDMFPAADVVPVVHGEWIDNTCCSECGWVNEVESGFIGDAKFFNFCPNCGAKMDGGEQSGSD